MKDSIYTSGEYLQSTMTWHVEDSPWKAKQIAKMMANNKISPKTIAEIGCGAGAILTELSKEQQFSDVESFEGFDISPQAIELARSRQTARVSFQCKDMFSDTAQSKPDVLLVIDVFEHVPDYMGFVEKCRASATYKIYHIPLDIHVSAILRDGFERARRELGHIHVFTQSSAIATLKDTGHEILDFCYTNGALDLFKQHPSVSRASANLVRFLLSKVNVPFTAKLLGGYSLLVLAK